MMYLAKISTQEKRTIYRTIFGWVKIYYADEPCSRAPKYN